MQVAAGVPSAALKELSPAVLHYGQIRKTPNIPAVSPAKSPGAAVAMSAITTKSPPLY